MVSETRSGSTWSSYGSGSDPRAAHLGEHQRLFREPRSADDAGAEAILRACGTSFDGSSGLLPAEISC